VPGQAPRDSCRRDGPARRGDRDCEPGGDIDLLIDERVAGVFVDEDAYARAEAVRGPCAAVIADELDLPAWVVAAFQRVLSRRAAPVWSDGYTLGYTVR